MNERLFGCILNIITILGLTSAVALVIWTIYLYRHCSIIAFIANGG